MNGIYWQENRARLRKYSASTTSGKGGKSVVRIEIEIADAYELSHFLDQLTRIENEQQASARAARSADRKQSSREQAALPAPTLMLEYQGNGE